MLVEGMQIGDELVGNFSGRDMRVNSRSKGPSKLVSVRVNPAPGTGGVGLFGPVGVGTLSAATVLVMGDLCSILGCFKILRAGAHHL